jgi:hypothetical protein
MKPTVCVDLYVLVDDLHEEADESMPLPAYGALEFTHRLGVNLRVIVYCSSAMCMDTLHVATYAKKETIEKWLKDHGLFFDELAYGPVKPIASAYIDADAKAKIHPEESSEEVLERAAKFAETLCGVDSDDSAFAFDALKLDDSRIEHLKP